VLTCEGITVYDKVGQPCGRPLFHVNWDQASVEKGGFAHYMLKEIYEQPFAIRSTFVTRRNLIQPEWLPVSAAN
jgi:glucosamine--fructose-6-phosphate aminotransferase (isomerizing)